MELTQRQPAGNDWRRWLSTRQGTFVIAAVSALIAAGIIAYALSRYRDNVNATGTQQTVLVATQQIEKGTAGDEIGVGQFFKPTKVLSKQVLAGAFTDPAALHGQIAAADIYPGQQLTASEFVAGGGLVSRLAASQRAISVPLEGSHGLIGNIHSGDHVDAYASFPSTSGRSVPVVRLLAPNVVVLSAGQSSGGGGLGGSGQASAIVNVALEVNTHQAAELAFAADNGKIWLTLRPGAGSPPDSQIVSLSSILAGDPTAPLEGAK
jgi:pilus assembly protein CpaB